MLCEYGAISLEMLRSYVSITDDSFIRPFFGGMWEQWLPESARYDVLTGNQEKALATLKRIATENGAPMPLGKLITARQVGACFCRAQTLCTLFM